jgi:ribonuclease HI
MGAGWRLLFTDRPEETGSAEWPAARNSTNNRAEYLALIGALEQYLTSGRPGLLLVQGDSQPVINQMTGDWSISNPALMSLNQQATALVKRVSGGVRYRWIPREENQVADTLAGGQPALEGTPPLYAEHPGGASVAPARAWADCTSEPGGQDEREARRWGCASVAWISIRAGTCLNW